MIATPTFPDCTLTCFDNREDWLRARGIGASDTAGIFGEGYSGQSAVSIWEEKRSGLSSIEETTRMRVGRIIEPSLREIFRQETKLTCDGLDLHVLRSREFDWMTATLDAVTEDPDAGQVPVELKNVDGRLFAEWRDEPPLKFQIQCQHQMAVTGTNRVYLLGLIGGNTPIVKTVRRSQAFIDAMVKKLAEFWGHVQDGTMPPIDGSEATQQALARLYPGDNGKSIELPPEAIAWADQLAEAKATIKEAEAEKREAENQLKAAMGENTFGTLPGGGSFSLKTTVRHNKAREASVSTFRVLRAKK
jgi:putative phage-type endonuclease